MTIYLKTKKITSPPDAKWCQVTPGYKPSYSVFVSVRTGYHPDTVRYGSDNLGDGHVRVLTRYGTEFVVYGEVKVRTRYFTDTVWYAHVTATV